MSEIKPISKEKTKFGEKINKQLTWAWYFNKWYEKLILVFLSSLGLWKLVELVFSWI